MKGYWQSVKRCNYLEKMINKKLEQLGRNELALTNPSSPLMMTKEPQLIYLITKESLQESLVPILKEYRELSDFIEAVHQLGEEVDEKGKALDIEVFRLYVMESLNKITIADRLRVPEKAVKKVIESFYDRMREIQAQRESLKH